MFDKMFGKKYDEIEKISFNCPKELSKKIDKICAIEFCSRTDVIKSAIKYFSKYYDRKLDRLNKIEDIKKRAEIALLFYTVNLDIFIFRSSIFSKT